jgi:hypothetical protein
MAWSWVEGSQADFNGRDRAQLEIEGRPEKVSGQGWLGVRV